MRPLSRFSALILMSLLVGCTPPALNNLSNIGRESDPTRFYTLNATVERVPENAPAMPYAVLGIGPVSVADHIDRSQIVVRESSNELTLAEFDRWAGNPSKEIQRVLAANLAAGLGTERVVLYPWKPDIDTDMTVEVTVDQFEYGGGKVWLVASWQVYADNGRGIVAFRRAALSREAKGNYNDIAAGLSELTGELSEEIAAVIRNAYRDRPRR